MNYTTDQQQFIASLFESYTSGNVRYVVPRGYAELPGSVPGSDIDVFVPPESFETASAICRRKRMATSESMVSNVKELVTRTAQNPERAIRVIRKSPQQAVSVAKKSVNTGQSTYQDYRERSFEREGVNVHLVNHLAYKSPKNGTKIRVDPAVEAAMLSRRKQDNGIYVPDAPDELAHLVCRGVFDYDGRFPDYYVEKCDRLTEIVRSDDRASAAFQELLSLLFYDASGLVYDTVIDGEYDSIRSRLLRYSDY